MSRIIKKIFILGSFILSTQVYAEAVLYTTNNYKPINTNGERVVYLDLPDSLLNDMFGQLSNNPAQAQAQAIATIQSNDFQTKQKNLADAYNGLITANNLGLKKVPAIVFNGKYVVYGTSDFNKARMIFEKMGTE